MLLFSIKPFTRKPFHLHCRSYVPLALLSTPFLRTNIINLSFSDSLSVLTLLRNKKLENPLIVKLLSRLDSMSSHKEIVLCWILSHIGVSGNERADSAAKSALDNISILYTDLKPQINKFFFTKWQQCWNNINNKLFQIRPTLWKWRPTFRKSRKEQVIISLLQIGHTHSFLLLYSSRDSHHNVWCARCLTPLNMC